MAVKTWSDRLAPYNSGGIILFEDEFLQQWGDQAWPQYEDPSSADEVVAAAKLHIQLASRITTQRLPYADGVEGAALRSVYLLFDAAREIFNAHSRCRLTEAISWHILNTHVRPFTARWHRQSERGALSALDATDIFRNELYALQQRLIRFDALLLEIRDGVAPPPAPSVEDSARERSIIAEMGRDLEWGIDRVLGGLPDTAVDAINREERAAVMARRLHYCLENAGPLSVVGAADLSVATTGNAAQLVSASTEREAWQNRSHAVALAVSGGGIRSATFGLGVLVALARRNLLYQFDYLSTVSGGGYLGAFLTTFLNAEVADGQGSQVGLRRDQLPFRRDGGEAAALRHVRHHSKYLATGQLWERLQMAFAQVYGMALNILSFAYLAILIALVEHLIRLTLPTGSFWPAPVIVAASALVLVSFLIPPVMRFFPGIRKSADAILVFPFLILLALLVWQGLQSLHEYYEHVVSRESALWLIAFAAMPLAASTMLALSGNLSSRSGSD